VARELVGYRLDSVDVQDVRWGKGGSVDQGIIFFSMEKETKSSIGNRIFVYSTEQYQQLKQ
jgi:hypothetical protein